SARTPVHLTVVGDLPAGSSAGPVVRPGTAARIMTGGLVPPGADAVVPVERTDGGTEVVRIDAPAGVGDHVRRAGEDVREGALVLAAGTLLGAAQVAAAAALGRGELRVHRRPRIGVVSTGSELVAPGQAVHRGQVTDSNSFLLAAAVRAAGGSAERIGGVPDDVDALGALLKEWDGELDAVVTTGGVGPGAFDVVRALLAAEMAFVDVGMQPGRPQGL